ncbi:hypothetical protein EG68_01812 [Paragonimus skrjabini miyazakii]|uniref:IMD domain-containing protein n=1 Tax=Paragonimus skrjabini miyazakii TaxID=59628 RepID=A0A8S9Z743_9TREM|nr:hypothetical protein EG68_01812 [Paragonimus skrjabini miyazakii]
MVNMKCDPNPKGVPVSFSFTYQLANLKNTLTLWEDMVSKTMKLNAALRTVIQCIAGFLEAFQKVADSAYSSNCGLRELGSSMTRFCLRERGLESRLRIFNSQLLDCLAAPLADRLEEWRRTVTQLDRENSKEWRRARNELQRVTCEFEKLNKRFRRKGNFRSNSEPVGEMSTEVNADSSKTGDTVQMNFVQHDLEVKQRTLAELERTNLRRAVVEERRRFAELITCLKPVLDSQTAIFSDVGSIEECITTILKHTYDPNELSVDTEQAIDLAVEQVASRIQLPERKRSDVRSVMRFGKNAFFDGPGNGSGSDFHRSSLSGHASQLSLQSAISSSTSVSWDAIVTTASAVSTTLIGNRSSSPTHSSCTGGDPVKPSPLSPCAISTTSAFGFGGDSVSLFENGDSSHVDTASLGLQLYDRSVVPYPTASEYSDAFRTVQIGTYRPPFAVDLNGASLTAATVEASSTNELLNDTDNRPHESTAPTANTDEEEEAGGGGTTEDTEDGETEDEERVGMSKSEVAKSQSILYPNQAIPAPVYTNLNELKRAAARKFGNTENDSYRTMEPTPYAVGLPNPTSDSSSFGSPDVQAASPGLDEGCPNIVYPVSTNSADGFINTCVNSGTSTFRRRQSEYGRKGQHITNDNLVTSRPVEYTSMTPALTRRTRQDLVDSCGGRPRSRPVNPPRRSSSVSRDMTRIRNSSTDPYPTCAFQPTTSAYHLQSNPQHFRSNDPDAGIQRVSSSIFAQSDAGTVRHSTNSSDKWAPMNLRNGRSDGVTVPISVPHYASVSTSSNYSQQANGTPTRSDRFPCVGLPLTPPPLATVPAPAYSKTNQLMFGVKVLPNQTPPIMGVNSTNQYSRLPQRTHQNNYESGQFTPTQASTGMGSPLLSRAVYSQRGVLPPKPVNNVVREDAITSFID